jgi:hypothetical protein
VLSQSSHARTEGEFEQMGVIYDIMLKFFQEDDWKFEPLEGQPVLRLGVSGANGRWMCYAQAREEQEQFVFYSVCPSYVPEHKRLAMAEFLTRANYGLVIGNFEMDFRDGEIRYKTSLDVEGGLLTPGMIKQAVYVNVHMMDRFLPAIMGVMYGGLTPEDAIKQVEG